MESPLPENSSTKLWPLLAVVALLVALVLIGITVKRTWTLVKIDYFDKPEKVVTAEEFSEEVFSGEYEPPADVARNLVYWAIEGSPQSHDNITTIIIPGKNRTPIDAMRPVTPPPMLLENPSLDLSTVRCVSGREFKVDYPKSNIHFTISTLAELRIAISNGNISSALFADFISRNDFVKWFDSSFNVDGLSSEQVKALRDALSEKTQHKMVITLENI